MKWRERLVVVAALGGALGVRPGAAAAQGVFAQGIVDLEGWKTDSSSFLLARNRGRPAALGRLSLWGGYQFATGLTVYALTEVEGGTAYEDGKTDASLEQLGVRWSPNDHLVIDAGKITSPVGAYASRRFSTRNPLIGSPDAYPVTYPVGAQVTGVQGIVDWRLAVLSLPPVHDGYSPRPTARARPAGGFGITPTTGVRFGASYTAGPYLGCELSSTELAGRSWHDFQQHMTAVDLELSRGYLELWAEGGRSSYEVPTRGTMRGTAAYVESRYTLTPRFFLAARAEENDYPFLLPRTTGWFAVQADVRNVEAGGGFRLTSSTLLKATMRRSWRRATGAGFSPDGHAIAVQLSQAFDVVGIVDRATREY